MLPDFIPNGHRRKVGFYEAKNIHREFTFIYLPFQGDDGSEALAKCGGKDGFIDKQKQRSVILERLVEWDFDRPMDDGALRQMAGPMYAKISGVVFDYLGPDFEVDGDE